MLQQAELGINNTALGTSTASKESRLLCTRLRKPPVLEHGNVPPPKGGEPLAAISDKDKPTWNAAAADDVQKYQNVPKPGLNFQTYLSSWQIKISKLVIISLPSSQLAIFYNLISAASVIFTSSSRDLEQTSSNVGKKVLQLSHYYFHK